MDDIEDGISLREAKAGLISKLQNLKQTIIDQINPPTSSGRTLRRNTRREARVTNPREESTATQANNDQTNGNQRTEGEATTRAEARTERRRPEARPEIAEGTNIENREQITGLLTRLQEARDNGVISDEDRTNSILEDVFNQDLNIAERTRRVDALINRREREAQE